MPLYVHKRYHAIRYTKPVAAVRAENGDVVEKESRSILQFESHRFATNDPKEVAWIESLADFKSGMLMRVPDAEVEETLHPKKKENVPDGKIECPVCKQACKSNAGLLTHMRSKHPNREPNGELSPTAEHGAKTSRSVVRGE